MILRSITILTTALAITMFAPACSDDATGGNNEDVCGDSQVTGSEACDDGNQLDADGCSATCTIEDGWLCEGSPSQCVIDCQSQRACDDGDACTSDLCDPQQGCSHEDAGADCNDGNPCTDDSCDPDQGCVTQNNSAACDDQNSCTENDTCLDGQCQGSALACDDQNACTADSCDPEAGCQHEDTSADCDDQNTCTTDSCDPGAGCVHDGTGITDPCDDSDACTSDDVCSDGECLGTPVDCDDNNPCTGDSCDPVAGCVYTVLSDPCDDGDVCTLEDTCAGGTCVGTPIDCDDGLDCTNDTCDPHLGCENSLISSPTCRPDIQVTYPPRAATIQDAGDPVVVVTGTVSSGAGPIASFTLNGEDVTLAQDGAFSHPVPATLGGNTLVFDAADEAGAERHRVQSFLWSPVYYKPLPADPLAGIVSQGLGAWLDQEVIDDGDHGLPIDDLATGVEVVLGNMDLEELIPSPLTSTSVAILGTYDIHLDNLNWNTPQVSLSTVNGGLALHLVITGIHGDLRAVKTCSFDLFTCNGPGSLSGDVSMSSIAADTILDISVGPDHQPQVTAHSTSVSINGLDVSIDGILGFLVDWIIDFFEDDFANSMEQELSAAIEDQIAPAVEGMLQGLDLSADYGIPLLDGSGTNVIISMYTDFNSIDFTSSGGTLVYRTSARSSQVTPYNNLGAPGRAGCGAGPQVLTIPDDSPISLGLSDNLITQLFYAAWMGGFLEFDVPFDMLGITQEELDEFMISDLQIHLSGMLAPTPSDCVSVTDLEVHTGDLKFDVSLNLAGLPMSVIGYATISFGVELRTNADREIEVVATGLRTAEVEANVQQDDYVALDTLFVSLLNDFLTGDQGLGALLDNQVLATIPIPEIDLSTLSGIPPGTAIVITPDSIARDQGNTIVRAHPESSK